MSMFDRISSALDYIQPSDHETRVLVAFGIHHELPDEDGFTLFDNWYRRHHRYDQNESRSTWASDNGGPTTSGTLFYLARQRGWIDPGEAEQTPLSVTEMADLKRYEEERKIREAAKVEREKQEAANLAAQIWSSAQPASPDHPYLVRKQVGAPSTLREIPIDTLTSLIGFNPKGAKGLLTGRVLLARVQQGSQLANLEMIDEQGTKTCLKGSGSRKAGFWLAQETLTTGTILVGEGVATVLSAQRATGYQAVATLSLGNFGPVLKFLLDVFKQDTNIILLADVDKDSGKPNKKLVKLAGEAGVSLAVPVFDEPREHDQTDFNDLFVLKGAEAVSTLINQAENEQTADPFAGQGESDQEETIRKFWNAHAMALIGERAMVVYRSLNTNTGLYTTRFTRLEDLSQCYRPYKVFNGQKNVPLVQAWSESPERKFFKQLVFKPIPGLIAGDTLLPHGEELNLYQGLSIYPKTGTWDLIREHIHKVWCCGSDSAFEYVLNWLARMFQQPDERGHTVLLLKSGEGAGKNIIIDMLVQAFGEHAMVAVKPEDLIGRFNDALATSVLVFANEAVWGGDKSLEGALKALITDEEIPVERKYVPKYRVKNCTHLMMASNNDWAAPIGIDDRRFVVLDLDERFKRDHDYFGKLRDEIRNGGREAFIYALMERDISDFNPRVLPEVGTSQHSKLDAKIRGADSVTQWWIDCLYRESIVLVHESSFGAVVTREERNIVEGWDEQPIAVYNDDLHKAYANWCKANGKRVEHTTGFGKKIGTLAKARRQRIQSGPRKGWCKILPKLEVLQKQMDSYMGQPGPWHFDDTGEVVETESLV